MQDNKRLKENSQLLVVDKDDSFFHFIEKELESLKFQIHHAKNNTEALNYLENNSYVFVTMDLALAAGENTAPLFKFLEENKEGVNYKTPIVVISSYCNDDFFKVIKNITPLALFYLSKPLERNVFLQLINNKYTFLKPIGNQNQKEILIIDNDLEVLNFLSLDMKRHEFNLDLIHDINLARKFLRFKKYDYIVLDIIMGVNKTSIELINFIKNEPEIPNKETPLIIMSVRMTNEYSSSIKKSFPILKELFKNLWKKVICIKKSKKLKVVILKSLMKWNPQESLGPKSLKNLKMTFPPKLRMWMKVLLK